MLGLSVGAAAGGWLISSPAKRAGVSAILFYALAEFLIGIGAFVVPELFRVGESVLLSAGETNSAGYLFLSALVLAVSILPFCLLMGTTFPFMMAYLRERDNGEATSFSFLYTANVLGAMCGTFLTAIVFIEIFGFHHTLQVAAVGNFLIALVGVYLAFHVGLPASAGEVKNGGPVTVVPYLPSGPLWPRERLVKWILFSTGFGAMALEVVWTRAFTPVLKTQVYSFALIVFAYLGATFAGSLIYRFHLAKNAVLPAAVLVGFLVPAVFFPVLACDPRLVKMDPSPHIYPFSVILTLASICALCAVLGYLTPRLIDEYAAGNPAVAGKAYAINVFGCIIGPLFASYLLLPRMSERAAMAVLSLPFFVFYLFAWKQLSVLQRTVSAAAAGALAIYTMFFSQDFENQLSRSAQRIEVRRDYAASVVSVLDTNGLLMLYVNNIGMTTLTPVTKFMVDLPLAFHDGAPKSALIICFGMGTTYRSALSWNIKTTGVELVPDVPRAFGFYHSDASNVLKNPQGRIVIDDGRRFLRRTREKIRCYRD